MENINENNIFLAVFLKYKFNKDNGMFFIPFLNEDFNADSLKFHSSWD